ncbi:uncharacterized protein TM35_000192470 [Trypanosoma theileri]|uniref:Uncharacterized protein n=1 Tax=Trypanosoma theileri TaxID=67003 RepID=A0A1X0NU43_9TRYP|nr:uncharacterized protein TM35_000192470 [Trypanosoma theileri]ORC88003.1 hypothetical protein TM35_000192470 [Trypanosoma theileri]
MAVSLFSSSTIHSVDDFRSVFTPNRSDRLLLCYEAVGDNVKTEELSVFENTVRAAAEAHGTKLQLHFWECSSNAFTAAKQQLGKERGTPLLAVVYRETIADTFRQSLSSMMDEMPRLCERLSSYQRGGKVAVLSSSSSSSLSPASTTNTTTTNSATAVESDARLMVDVSKLVGMGKRLMAEGKAEYAGKFFQRAVDALDAVLPHCNGDNNVNGSLALCLAWTALAQIVQGRSAEAYMQRLETQYVDYCMEIGSDAARVRSTYRLISAMPFTWRSDTCSERRLREILVADPHSHNHRCALVVTLFLAGDIERCLTEAVKLRVLNIPFGTTAIAAVADFMGRDHPLLLQCSRSEDEQAVGKP